MGVRPLPGFEEFAAQLDSDFVASVHDGDDIRFRLVEAKDLFSDERFQSFSLLFRAPLDSRAEQGTFALENEGVGVHDLFLVPVMKTDEGLFFEASFNLVR